MRLIAKKSMRYGTRMLQAGDEFEASRRDARVLKALKRVTDAPEPEPEPEAVPAPSFPAKEPEPKPEPEPEDAEPTVSATELRRMRKADLMQFLQDAGQEFDEDTSRDVLLEHALAVREQIED